MKKIIVKYAIILPFVLFAIYVGLALLGCVSCVAGASDAYFCNTYCPIAKTAIVLILATYAGFFAYSMYRERTSIV